MPRISVFSVLLALSAACGPFASSTLDVVELEVGPSTVACRGEAEQRCLQVREGPDQEWRNFYDTIEGFTYEERFLYRIRVERTRIPDPVADGSAFSWSLIEVLSKEPAPTG
jgi:hypothetical protein